jgi:hypothetical protein
LKKEVASARDLLVDFHTGIWRGQVSGPNGGRFYVWAWLGAGVVQISYGGRQLADGVVLTPPRGNLRGPLAMFFSGIRIPRVCLVVRLWVKQPISRDAQLLAGC